MHEEDSDGSCIVPALFLWLIHFNVHRKVWAELLSNKFNTNHAELSAAMLPKSNRKTSVSVSATPLSASANIRPYTTTAEAEPAYFRVGLQSVVWAEPFSLQAYFFPQN